jgi:microcystin-dependent protein
MPNVSLLTSGIGDVNQGGSLVPTGTVFAFAGSTAPSGWLVCDGTAYSQTTYSSLFAVLGSTYNTQTNPTTNAAWATPTGGTFRVPDYRGIFLRSSGQASGQTVVTVGGHQEPATKRPTVAFTGNYTTPRNVSSGWAGWFVSEAETNRNHAMTLSSADTTTINGGGDSETRPINKGVLYIIKV